MTDEERAAVLAVVATAPPLSADQAMLLRSTGLLRADAGPSRVRRPKRSVSAATADRERVDGTP